MNKSINAPYTQIEEAMKLIQSRLSGAFVPKVGLVLGSGLGSLVDHIDVVLTVPYADIPGFIDTSVEGHAGNLILGRLNGMSIACLQGRLHHYEGIPFQAVKIMVRVLKCLGCEYYLGTNAAGSLNIDYAPGDLVLVTDHINFQGGNPLVGMNDDDFGPRFLSMDHAYDQPLRKTFLNLAKACDVTLHQGIYLGVLGPCYETVSEIRAFRLLGADVVGMSTIPEVIVARHCGLKVGVVSVVTNYATGLTEGLTQHGQVIDQAAAAMNQLVVLLEAVVTTLRPDSEMGSSREV